MENEFGSPINRGSEDEYIGAGSGIDDEAIEVSDDEDEIIDSESESVEELSDEEINYDVDDG